MIFSKCKQKVNFTLVGGVRVYDLGRFHMSEKPNTFQWKNGAAGSKAKKTRREQSARVWSALNGSYITKESVTSEHKQLSIAEANKELLSNIRETRSHISTNKENFVDENNSLINSLDENEKQLLESGNKQQNVRLQELQGKTAGIEEAITMASKAGAKIDYNIIFKNLTSNDVSSVKKTTRNVVLDQVNKKAKKFGIKKKSVRTLILDDKNKLKNELRGITQIERVDKETAKNIKGRRVDLAKFGAYPDSEKASREKIKELTGRKPTDKKPKKNSVTFNEKPEAEISVR